MKVVNKEDVIDAVAFVVFVVMAYHAVWWFFALPDEPLF